MPGHGLDSSELLADNSAHPPLITYASQSTRAARAARRAARAETQHLPRSQRLQPDPAVTSQPVQPEASTPPIITSSIPCNAENEGYVPDPAEICTAVIAHSTQPALDLQQIISHDGDVAHGAGSTLEASDVMPTQTGKRKPHHYLVDDCSLSHVLR